MQLSAQSKDKFKASTTTFACRNCSIVKYYSILHYSQSQACATHFAAATFIYPVKTFEYAVKMLFRYTTSIVREAEIIKFAVAAVTVELYCAVVTGIGNGIVEQVAEY